jgi:hypothetical protein
MNVWRLLLRAVVATNLLSMWLALVYDLQRRPNTSSLIGRLFEIRIGGFRIDFVGQTLTTIGLLFVGIALSFFMRQRPRVMQDCKLCMAAVGAYFIYVVVALFVTTYA